LPIGFGFSRPALPELLGDPVARRGRIDGSEFIRAEGKIETLAVLQHHADFMIHGTAP
jgi:hypothetical protein